MPLPKGTRYGVKTYKSGKRVRMAWNKGKLIETKNIDSGAIHTPAEFAKDHKKKPKKNKVKSILRKALNKLKRK